MFVFNEALGRTKTRLDVSTREYVTLRVGPVCGKEKKDEITRNEGRKIMTRKRKITVRERKGMKRGNQMKGPKERKPNLRTILGGSGLAYAYMLCVHLRLGQAPLGLERIADRCRCLSKLEA